LLLLPNTNDFCVDYLSANEGFGLISVLG